MNRYDYTTIDKRRDGKRVYKTLLYPSIPESPSDIYITVSDNDYIDQIAYRYYKDVSLWWIIAIANNLGKGKLSLDINKQLRIPTDIQTILQNFTLINS